MKLLVTGDFHPDVSTMGVSRFEEIRSVLFDQILPAIDKDPIDAFIFAGDLCDPDSGPIVFRILEMALAFAKQLELREVEQLWIAGNHDVIEDGSGATTLTPMLAIESDTIHIHEQPRVVTLKNYLKVISLPFVATHKDYDPVSIVMEGLKDHRKGVGNPVAVVGHLNIPGVIPGEETTEMPRGRSVRFPIEACQEADLLLHGHYHRQQRTESGIWIPGSLCRLTFGEEEYEPAYLRMEI